ncbi:MAG TPA: LysM peptidoglycan-binding domain-containing protein [Anaerolineales bacterium]
MQAVRQLGNGILYGLVSIVLVVGGLSLALAESYTSPSPAPTTSLPTIPQTLTSTQAGPTALPSATSTLTATPLPPTNCLPPTGWVLISVQPYDTLESIAFRFRIAPYQLAQANCLFTHNLEPGFNLYVPPLPTQFPTLTMIPCGPPYGWIRAYVVQPQDSLYHIAELYRTTVFDLQRANCLYTIFITPGSWLWVPNVPTITPSVIVINIFGTSTPTASETSMPTYTSTSTPIPPTATTAPTATYTVTIPPTPTSPPPTATVTAFPTSTP